MPATHKPLRALNIFLAKPEFRGAEALLKKPAEYDFHPVKAGGVYLGMLFIRPSYAKQPDWVSLFTGSLDVSITELPLRTSSAAAVLIIERGGFTFLITFGYGWSMIQEGVVETRFGLVATLNAIHPDRIRSLDRRSFERIQRLSRDQTSQETGFAAFGLNVEQDLVRAVTGVPTDRELGARLAGRDSLATTVACELADIPNLLGLYKKIADQTYYKQRYPWIDNIAEVADRQKRDRLDLQLVRHIQRNELDAIVLCPPELLDWQEVAGFRYRNARDAELYADLTWPAYFQEVRAPAEVTVDRLKGDRIACIRTDGEGALTTWSLRNCIAGELSYGGSRYVLSEGRWYRIDDSYAARVEAAVKSVPSTQGGLPDYDHSSEEDYNSSVAAQSGGRLALMDQKMIQATTVAGSIEMCDLYSLDRRIIHVKRYGASSVLSHLFAQGTVSARLFLSDRAFRGAVNNLLPASHQLSSTASTPNPREYEIAYAVVGKYGRDLRLPFFSLVNLKNALDLLTQIGYAVTLTHIKNLRQ